MSFSLLESLYVSGGRRIFCVRDALVDLPCLLSYSSQDRIRAGESKPISPTLAPSKYGWGLAGKRSFMLNADVVSSPCSIDARAFLGGLTSMHEYILCNIPLLTTLSLHPCRAQTLPTSPSSVRQHLAAKAAASQAGSPAEADESVAAGTPSGVPVYVMLPLDSVRISLSHTHLLASSCPCTSH